MQWQSSLGEELSSNLVKLKVAGFYGSQTTSQNITHNFMCSKKYLQKYLLQHGVLHWHLLISKHFKVALVSHTHHTSALWIQAKGVRGHPQLQRKLEAELGLCENLSHKT